MCAFVRVCVCVRACSRSLATIDCPFLTLVHLVIFVLCPCILMCVDFFEPYDGDWKKRWQSHLDVDSRYVRSGATSCGCRRYFLDA
jgi:hypothetical protein